MMYLMIFCRGSHHGSQIGQSRNSVKFASPTHHRYSAASDNIGNLRVMMMMMMMTMMMVMMTPQPTTDNIGNLMIMSLIGIVLLKEILQMPKNGFLEQFLST